ncbi:MAG: lysophospholipid acyltransferase family protein [Bacteroidota bacterium]|jgi:1-acyl-sn-glycerol-3-phosphate acyltransferase|nr:lysophospholipid acyltransferase family protein [Bacteroidota bacterium]HHU97382.1 1-acyl-sn-glycerol-3-phosphate acyltransferase [Petrimonas sp.]
MNKIMENPVVRNIREATEKGLFHVKVEQGEPKFNTEEKREIIDKYLQERETIAYWIKNRIVTIAQNGMSLLRNVNTKYIGTENVKTLRGRGAIVTSNHFNPLENTAILRVIKKIGRRKKMYAISQVSNFKMPGTIGFLLRYANVIPISKDSIEYMCERFCDCVHKVLKKNNYILIYPEQEMWRNYRKPRPLKLGAYFYAAKINVPILPCFVEIRDERTFFGIWNTRYFVHILPVITPDPTLDPKADAKRMSLIDYEQKKNAYERAYGRPLDYAFEVSDIAGGLR